LWCAGLLLPNFRKYSTFREPPVPIFSEKSNQIKELLVPFISKPVKEPAVITEALVKNRRLYVQLFDVFKFLNLVIYQNQLFDFLDPWLCILRTALIAAGVCSCF
jgi:hypothetical protein